MDLQKAHTRYEGFKKAGLALDMTRGQPGDDNFDLSNPMLTIVDESQLTTPSGIHIRNYPGGIYGLPEARKLFADVLGVRPEETLVGNNASLELMGKVLTWALLKGLPTSPRPWVSGPVKFIVTTPGYDRHFTMLETLGIELVPVAMTPQGPDLDQVERLSKADPAVKGMLFVPTYSNPTGDTITDENVRRLAALEAAAEDFTIFADDAYAVHHLTDNPVRPLNLLQACSEAGHPQRAFLFGSTSKITFAGAGLGFMAASEANLAYVAKLMGSQSIGPNKIEQYRHVRFLESYPGGLGGLMRDHARLLRPKFEAVQRVLEEELGACGLARWSQPKGGYFVSLDTAKPVADRVVALAKDAGVALTPAGATYPGGVDPANRNIRLSPTRPPLEQVEQAMRVVAVCVQLASLE